MSKKFTNKTLTRLQARARQRGYSNIQIAIGILVTIIALLGALSGYQYIQQAKVNNEISMLTDLKSATIRLGGGRPLFTGTEITVANLSGMNFFQGAGLTVTGATVSNQWGGTVTPSVGTISQAGDSLTFTFTGVPTGACRELGTKVDNIAARVEIGGTETKAPGGTTAIGDVVTGCNSATDSNTIAYTFAR